MDISVALTPELTLKNPIMSASGTFAYGEEFAEFFDLSILGAVVTKGLSWPPRLAITRRASWRPPAA